MLVNYTKTFYAVLENLQENYGNFKQVADILAELAIPDPGGQLATKIDRELYKGRLVSSTENDGVMIVGKGERALEDYKKIQ